MSFQNIERAFKAAIAAVPADVAAACAAMKVVVRGIGRANRMACGGWQLTAGSGTPRAPPNAGSGGRRDPAPMTMHEFAARQVWLRAYGNAVRSGAVYPEVVADNCVKEYAERFGTFVELDAEALMDKGVIRIKESA